MLVVCGMWHDVNNVNNVGEDNHSFLPCTIPSSPDYIPSPTAPSSTYQNLQLKQNQISPFKHDPPNSILPDLDLIRGCKAPVYCRHSQVLKRRTSNSQLENRSPTADIVHKKHTVSQPERKRYPSVRTVRRFSF